MNHLVNGIGHADQASAGRLYGWVSGTDVGSKRSAHKSAIGAHRSTNQCELRLVWLLNLLIGRFGLSGFPGESPVPSVGLALQLTM